jgi:hypothetical protein
MSPLWGTTPLPTLSLPGSTGVMEYRSDGQGHAFSPGVGAVEGLILSLGPPLLLALDLEYPVGERAD